MFRISIPLAMLVGIGLAARLTSQENLSPDGQTAESAAELAVESDSRAINAALELVVEEEEEHEGLQNEIEQGHKAARKPEVRDVDVELELMLSQAERGADAQTPAGARAGEPPAAAGWPAGTPGGQPGAPAPGAPADGRVVKIFRLKYAEAGAVAEMIDRLFQDVAGLITHADDRTNSLIVRATPPDLQQILEFLEAIDKTPPQEGQTRRMRVHVRPGEVAPAPGSGPAVELRRRRLRLNEDAPPGTEEEEDEDIIVERLPAHRNPLIVPPSPGRDVLIFNDRPDRVARVVPLDRGREQEHELAVLAQQIRNLRAAVPPDEEAIKNLETQLREQVTSAFEARQAAQRAELTVLEQQLQVIKQEIERRDQEKETLIQQRVDEWLSGNVKHR